MSLRMKRKSSVTVNILLYRMVLPFESVDEILNCVHSDESSSGY